MPTTTKETGVHLLFAIICVTYVGSAVYTIQRVPLWMDEVLAVTAAMQSGWSGGVSRDLGRH